MQAISEKWDAYAIERCILGAYLREGLPGITLEIRPKHFSKIHHRIIAYWLRQGVTNLIDLSDRLKDEGKLAAAGGNGYLSGLLVSWIIFKSSNPRLAFLLDNPALLRQFVQGLLGLLKAKSE